MNRSDHCSSGSDKNHLNPKARGVLNLTITIRKRTVPLLEGFLKVG